MEEKDRPFLIRTMLWIHQPSPWAALEQEHMQTATVAAFMLLCWSGVEWSGVRGPLKLHGGREEKLTSLKQKLLALKYCMC